MCVVFFSFKGYSLTSVCILGLLGNCLTCLVLAQYQIFSTFSKLLTGLAIIDSLLLLVFLLDSGLPSLFGQPSWYLHAVPYIHPIKVE